jgi:RNA polymerase sigma-70 factor (ECF subfamily)
MPRPDATARTGLVEPTRRPTIDRAVSTDEELLSAWRGGDTRAGAQLFDHHFRALTRFFRNKQHGAIDDLIQQTMLGLLEGKDEYRSEGSFRSYVFGVAYNVLRNHYRQARREAERLDFGVTSIFDLALGPAEQLVERNERLLLLQALRRIPIEHQVLLELYFWEPLPAPEIAVILGVPEGTVRTRIRRAKALLEAEVGHLTTDRSLLESTISNLDDWARAVRASLVEG